LYFLSRARIWSKRLRPATRVERKSPACEEELVTPGDTAVAGKSPVQKNKAVGAV
jgi:hypothetical protein